MDKIGRGDWRAQAAGSPSLFVNAAAWGLMLTGKLVATHSEGALGAALTKLIARGGEPLVLAGMDAAMKLLGQQFVLGRTIAEALDRARSRAERGYTFSFDMLGEAALSAADAQRYADAYAAAIDAIGAVAGGNGPRDGPGVSVKLSALHPRYCRAQRCRAQRHRVLDELLPRVRTLALRARRLGIGFTIDAEESERLALSLELIEALAHDTMLAGWDGLGAAVQAYGKRAPFVLDELIACARAAGRRLQVRLVKGAYWDSEIKRAQVEGQADYPVYTRKRHSDVAYLACARKMLAAPDALYPQFATHNALTAASVAQLAAEAGHRDWEYQCLHGMGEPLYDRIVAGGARCRIYAPVGSHETLLAYLVRRLLENGANSSFVHQLVDPAVAIDALLQDPVERAAADGGEPHPRIALPADLFGAERRNSAGLDLNDEATLAALDAAFAAAPAKAWHAAPAGYRPGEDRGDLVGASVTNPANRAQRVGTVVQADAGAIERAAAAASAFAATWAATPAAQRAAALDRAAELLERHRAELMWLAVAEAGKTLANALGEVREAVDFLRYYAAQVRAPAFDAVGAPLGVVAAISPWNFPLAIFVRQVAAALAAGNTVLAKPAEQTPLIAAHAVGLLHAAGVPADALHLLPGDGRVGAALVADARVAGVLFTGSTEVAQAIDRSLAARESGAPIPLVAETGGLNAMIVDSSALPEQAVADALASAFDSAGQRCSALRVLCGQEEVAAPMLAMLEGALAELCIGDPRELATDIGPVIDDDARARLQAHIDAIAAHCPTHTVPLPAVASAGSFVAPTVIEIPSLAALRGEVFGPVLHVLRYRRDQLPQLLDAIDAAGYGLTLGIQSRIDEMIDAIVARARVGNVYVNRNMIGAVVGVQPFGGEGLSGTGPKAGGPLYLHRLRRDTPSVAPAALGATRETPLPPALGELERWAAAQGDAALAAACRHYADASPAGCTIELPGPTGECNRLRFAPRRVLLCAAEDAAELAEQLAAALACGARAVLDGPAAATLHARLPAAAAAQTTLVGDTEVDGALATERNASALRRRLAARDGPRLRVVLPVAGRYPLHELVAERSVTVNTTAAGGNASLMALQDG
ncbi:MAG: bifunctional proline dehydrogenase/L-glutamate gamma-semialdehyde dehydrogenase PutA [Burkholderiales bacterium]|nr:bifunctional proline dehydrogenase/L-glutamate gamma-semialdehyde dehydrogenase PutA [Burkholderiales bacterium]